MADPRDPRYVVDQGIVPPSDPNPMRPVAAPQPAAPMQPKPTNPETGYAENAALTAALPALTGAAAYAARNPSAIANAAKRSAASLPAGFDIVRGISGVNGNNGDSTLGSWGRLATGLTGMAGMVLNKPAAMAVGAIPTALDVGNSLTRNYVVEPIRQWLATGQPQRLKPAALPTQPATTVQTAAAPAMPNLGTDAQWADVFAAERAMGARPASQGDIRRAEPVLPGTATGAGPVTSAARSQATAAPADARMAPLTDQADAELRNLGMDQLVAGLLAKEGAPAAVGAQAPAEGSIGRAGTAYNARGGRDFDGYTLPAQAPMEGDKGPVEVIRGLSRTMAAPTEGAPGQPMSESRIGAPQLAGFEPAQISAYARQLAQSSDPRDQAQLRELITAGVNRANNIETTAGGVTQQVIAREGGRDVATIQGNASRDVAGTQAGATVKAAEIGADKPTVVPGGQASVPDGYGGYRSVTQPSSVLYPRTGEIRTPGLQQPAPAAPAPAPAKAGKAPRMLNQDQYKFLQEQYPNPDDLVIYMKSKGYQKPS